MLIGKLKEIIGKVKSEIEEITDLVPEDKKKVIKELIIEAAMAYGKVKIQEEMNNVSRP